MSAFVIKKACKKSPKNVKFSFLFAPWHFSTRFIIIFIEEKSRKLRIAVLSNKRALLGSMERSSLEKHSG